MIKLIVGFVLGMIVCAEAGIIGYCIWHEKHYPETLDYYRRAGYKNGFHGETHSER